MRIARRILSPLVVLVGFALVAAGMYATFITFSARAANWPVVALGASVMALGLLVHVAPLSRRLIGIALALVGVALFVLGYPLFGVLDAPNLSWLWIFAVVFGAAGMIIARGRSWWSLLAALGLGIVYVGIGLFVGFGPVGWWPVDLRLPQDLGMWVSTVLGAFWPVQVLVMAGLLLFTLLAAGAIDPSDGRAAPKPANGTMDA